MVVVDLAKLGSTAGRTDFAKEFDVGLVVVRPLRRQIVFVIDSFDRANRLTGTTVDAFVWVNVKHAVTLIDAVNRTLFNASLVLDVDARKRDYVSHESSLTVPGRALAPSRGTNLWEQDDCRAECDRTVRPNSTEIVVGNQNFATNLLLSKSENRDTKGDRGQI